MEMLTTASSSSARARRSAAARPSRSANGRSEARGDDGAKAFDGDHDDDDDEEEEEEEDEEIEEVVDDEAQDDDGRRNGNGHGNGRRSAEQDLQSFVKGALVQILKTSDVEQRVPHTVDKVGIIEDVPQHPNTWFKVRIRDGDVVYKYRPSALQLLDAPPHATPLSSPSTTSTANAPQAQSPSRSPSFDQNDAETATQSQETNDQDHEEEEVELDVNMRVRVQLSTLSRRERDLRKHQGKEGMILERGPDGFKVQLDGDKRTTIVIKQKHLTLASAPRDSALDTFEYEDEDDEEEKDDNEEDDGSDQDTPKGELLSDLDPDMWIDRKCRINVGKFKGMSGRVLRSGNGWVQLKLENSNENTAKRAYELTLLEDMDTIKELYAKTVEAQKKAAPKHQDEAAPDEEEDEEEVDDGDDGARSGGEENGTAMADNTDDSQGEESSNGIDGKRSRRLSTRGSYGISWIEKKVLLPNRKSYGIVKKADRETCTVEVGSSKVLKVFKKKELELVDDESKGGRNGRNANRTNGKGKDRYGIPEGVTLMGTTPSRYAAFQDQVKKFIMRKRERVKKRPNLQEWQAKLDLKFMTNSHNDEYDPAVVDLLVIPHCEICGKEKESVNGTCWNPQCPRCINFDVDSFVLTPDHFARLPMVPLSNENVTNAVTKLHDEAIRKRKRKSEEAASNEEEQDDDVPPAQKALKRSQSTESNVSVKKKSSQSKTKAKKSPKHDAAGSKKSPKARTVKSPTAASPVASTTGFRPQYESVFSR